MSYVVTARKWRPKKFSEVVGQEHITTTLKNAIKDGRIAHAYLFAGPRGVGKTTTARILAKSLNCLNSAGYEPCNECENCKAIKAGQFMDIIEIDGASNRGIDEIRTLRESVKYAPSKGKYKVYIIDEVHMLTRESFNAFLKTLEEPPSQTIFIFATTDVHKVPLTIISRCQRFDFRRIEMETIKSLLSKIAKSEKIEIDDKTLTLIARKADGALRDAESYFDQVVSFCGRKIDSTTVSKILNLIDDEVYFLISDAVLNKNFKSVFEATDLVYKNGWNFTDFMDGLTEHFRNIMTVIVTESTQSVESAEVYKKRYLDYIGKFSKGDILRLLNYLNKSGQELRYSQNQKLKIEIALSHLVGLEKTFTISELIENLDNGNIELPASSEPLRFRTGKDQHQKKSPVIQDKNVVEKKRIVTYKDPVQEPQQNYSVNLSSDFDSIVKKWKDFANLVSEEKKITLGNFFAASQPIDLSGTRLSLQFKNDEEIKSFNLNIPYLTKKAHEYFGKKLQFKAVEESTLKAERDESYKKSTIESGKTTSTGDQYVDLIVNELGGEEIS